MKTEIAESLEKQEIEDLREENMKIEEENMRVLQNSLKKSTKIKPAEIYLKSSITPNNKNYESIKKKTSNNKADSLRKNKKLDKSDKNTLKNKKSKEENSSFDIKRAGNT